MLKDSGEADGTSAHCVGPLTTPLSSVDITWMEPDSVGSPGSRGLHAIPITDP